MSCETVSDERLEQMRLDAQYGANSQSGVPEQFKQHARDMVSLITELQSLRSKASASDAEQIVMGHLVSAWNAFVDLPVEHSDARDEFRHGIHALQCQVMSRPALRIMNEKIRGEPA